MKKLIPASIALALAVPLCSMAQSPQSPPAETQSLRQEIEAMRAAYEARLQALEQRVLAAERVTTDTAAVALQGTTSMPT